LGDEEASMRKPRKPETDEERSERHDRAAQLKKADVKAADGAIDAMIRTSINLYGP
jgi:hypothetical protein